MTIDHNESINKGKKPWTHYIYLGPLCRGSIYTTCRTNKFAGMSAKKLKSNGFPTAFMANDEWHSASDRLDLCDRQHLAHLALPPTNPNSDQMQVRGPLSLDCGGVLCVLTTGSVDLVDRFWQCPICLPAVWGRCPEAMLAMMECHAPATTVRIELSTSVAVLLEGLPCGQPHQVGHSIHYHRYRQVHAYRYRLDGTVRDRHRHYECGTRRTTS